MVMSHGLGHNLLCFAVARLSEAQQTKGENYGWLSELPSGFAW
jgi:hypothetical protein